MLNSCDKKLYVDIYRFLLPAMAENILLTSINTITSAIVGKIGSVELSGVSIATTILYIVQALFTGLGLGSTVRIALAPKKDTNKITGISLELALLLAALLFIVFIFCIPGILQFLFRNSSPNVREIAAHYLRLCKFTFPFLAMDSCITACLRGASQIRKPLTITIFAGILNVTLCFFFVFGLQLGYIGSTYAYIIATLLLAVLKLLYLLKPGHELFLDRLYKLDFDVIGRIMQISFPSMIEKFLIRTGFLGMQTVTALLGTSVLAGYQITNNILNFLYAFTAGIEVTQITFVSRFVKEKNKHGAKVSAYGLLLFGEVLMGVLAILIFADAKVIASLFTNDTTTMDSAVWILRLMCFTVPFTTCFQSIQGAMKTCNDINFVTFMNIGTTWLLRIPLAYVLVKYGNLGFYGLFVAFALDYILRAAAFLYYAKKEHWYPLEKET